MISVFEALSKVMEHVSEPHIIQVDLGQSLGMILAQEIVARDNIPPFDNSAMDGYALKSADAQKGMSLEVVEDLPAGMVAKKRVQKGQASVIMTGAPLPEGADCVIEAESTKKLNGKVQLLRDVKKQENVRGTGEDIRQSKTVAHKGEKITPVVMGLAASLGYSRLGVYRKPEVSILSTGSEIIAPEEELRPGKIRDSNSYFLRGLCQTMGIEPKIIGIAKDNRENTEKKLKTALESDVAITTGGVSVGEYDFVKDVLESIGAEQIFWSVAQKPGKPLGFYILEDKKIFALPGNPVAAHVCFEVYIRPFILKSMGALRTHKPLLSALAGETIKKKEGRSNWLRVDLKEEKGQLKAFLTGAQGSGILTSMKADGLLYLDAKSSGVAEGDSIEVLLLNEN